MTTAADAAHMAAAIALARGAMGTTWPNPTVGCVIALGGQILAQGVTARGGRPHAEQQAVAALTGPAKGATAYVTLEPCGVRSSGEASCSERLAMAGVARVVWAVENPDPLSLGQGPARLKGARVVVESGLLAGEAAPLYAGFLHRLATGRPRIEAADGPASYDAMFEPQSGETLEAALQRLGAAGLTRVWTPRGGLFEVGLSQAGLLSPNLLEVLR